ncbi:VOC family protein [Chitinophaga qingshengii]|uniref:VOC family protein n=1 Tax=Chitinophaga qingshengii TaxID=1569794 RepID=A0ABR7TFG6_9BACT|nr:VOC family protein [Chitinophaga qingshengii]MBC9929062.1 VOC family protein [Chitinophaga qingshengii]
MLKHAGAFSSFSVNDIQQAKTFYEDSVGLKVNETPEGLELKVDGGPSVFLYGKPNHTPATFTVLNFIVDNVDEAVEQLTRKGVRFQHYTGEIATDEKGIFRDQERGMSIAWFADPAGNILSVLQEKK